jgi:nitroreductase
VTTNVKDVFMIEIRYPNPVNHDVSEAVAKRYSPRAFSSKAVPREILLTLLEAARWSASSYNEQPWRFILATKEHPQDFETMLSCLHEGNQAWASHAPVLLLTLAKTTLTQNGKHNKHAWHDVGQAVATLALEAVSHDLYLRQMGAIYPDKVRELYDVPAEFDVVSGVALGYRGDIDRLPEDLQIRERRERLRKPLEELVFTKQFGYEFRDW